MKGRRAADARREKLAAIAAEERRRRVRILSGLGVVVAVVLVIVIMVAIKLTGDNSSGTDVSGPAAAGVIRTVTSVPPKTFAKVGPGNMQTPPTPVSGAPLTQGGKPKVLYVGAEYCPYCAAERWAVVAALSRFGTWSHLGETSSTSRDVFPDTQTLSFHGADYSSSYLAFDGFEIQDRNGQPLDTLPKADQKIFDTYDRSPYVDSQHPGSIPFVDIGGKYLVSGASYSPEVLSGLSHAQIAKRMADPSTKVAKAVDGTANAITAAVCAETHKPASVCDAPGVKSAASELEPAS